MALILAGCIAVALLATGIRFTRWRKARLNALYSASRIARTAFGPVEYVQVGGGPPVLLCHGTGCGCDQGEALARFLRGDGTELPFLLLTPSRPGYLRTPLEAGRTPEQQADVLAALLDQLGIEQVVAIGLSGGGPCALQFGLRHPRRTRALVMVAAVSQACRLDQDNPSLQRVLSPRIGNGVLDLASWFLSHLALHRPATLARRWFPSLDDLEAAELDERIEIVLKDPRQVRCVQDFFLAMLPVSVRRAGLRNDCSQFAQLPVYPLEQLRIPTLVIHGRADTISFVHAEFTARTIPGAELLAVERCGHLIFVGDAAEQVRSVLLEFLAKHTEPKTGSA
jgi:pimeloyl-ACP methyl ester carboxylesterase